MKLVKYICRIVTGTVFIFSGTVKAIDPLGFVYKLQDYFQAFSVGFLKSLALPLVILLCTIEFMAGFSVLFNLRQKAGIWTVMAMMMIFTPLTLILALTNPVTDCGCFGEAIHLTNWQTFLKNIILLIPAIYLFIRRKEIRTPRGSNREWVIITITAVLFNFFLFYNLRYLPVIDFLPYKTGTHIADKMRIPEGKEAARYKSTFIYEKDGVKKEFSLENYPANDPSWKFVEQRSVLLSKGYEPPIHDFIIRSVYNEDLTDQILSSKGYTMLMVSRKLDEADQNLLRKGFELGYYCMGNLIEFFVLTASGSDEVRKFDDSIKFCLADETTLKTMVRANPGYILLKEGTIMGKWSWANVPEKETLIRIINNQ